jgi:hypothetical protein
MDLLCSGKEIFQIECEKLCKIRSAGNFFQVISYRFLLPPHNSTSYTFFILLVQGTHRLLYIFRRLILQGVLLTHICKTHAAYEGIFLDFLYDRKKQCSSLFYIYDHRPWQNERERVCMRIVKCKRCTRRVVRGGRRKFVCGVCFIFHIWQ